MARRRDELLPIDAIDILQVSRAYRLGFEEATIGAQVQRRVRIDEFVELYRDDLERVAAWGGAGSHRAGMLLEAFPPR